MPTYRLLIHPSANRVYAGAAPALAAAELRTVADLVMPGEVTGVEVVPTGRAPAVRFTTTSALAGPPARLVATCAGGLALFEEHGGACPGDVLLAPLDPEPLELLPDDLLTTLKYAGKTNERFTALMVNLALAASRRGFAAALAGEPVRLLDPLCGRGTTLSQALAYGLDAVGIEQRDKEVEAYLGFLRQWLRDHRVRHRSESTTMRRGGSRERTGRRVTITFQPPTGRQQVADLVADDTVNARDHLGGSSVDLIVSDLPYGVQHAARTDRSPGHRNPAVLLQRALPVWRGVLRGGGAVCLAFNTNVIGRDEVDAALADNDLRPVTALTDGRFAHRVDRAIRRDVALAVKPC